MPRRGLESCGTIILTTVLKPFFPWQGAVNAEELLENRANTKDWHYAVVSRGRRVP